ncbi:glycosyltransferase family 2 protein [Desulfogranum japonicum]|uniref:glycosyltransferase family 2 protein n=1 Tax=Desulfogranum japonicum TaxID=231447 RepID=UPI00042243F5|nr:glycosyltransferase family 2 protein [Desulfogranum japonicum]
MQDNHSSEQERLIREQARTIERLNKQIQEMEQSKVWRIAEFFRRLIRVHFLNWFPSIQIYYLPLFKRTFRRYVLQPLIRGGFVADSYTKWMRLEEQFVKQTVARSKKMESSAKLPTISLLMPVYNVEPVWLEAAICSVLDQSYGRWQLCIADDCSTKPGIRPMLEAFARKDERITISFLAENLGIVGASNAALEMATGDYIGLLDNDDTLAPHALQLVAEAIDEKPEAECFYSDEDKISEQGRRYEPFFKPDWSPDTLRSYNYLCHFTVIKRDLFLSLGGFRPGYDGSQDYDLFLRVSEQAREIEHIPHILYHWRAIEGSVGKRGDAKMYAYDSAKKALNDHLDRLHLPAKVEDGLFLGSYRIRYQLAGQHRVAIIIPTKDKVSVLKRCVDSILSCSTYGNYHVYIVDNGSSEQATFEYYASLDEQKRVSLFHFDEPFNFSKINNFAVRETKEEFLVFLNNDTEILSPEWLEEMLGYAQRQDVGAVGSLLYYPNNTVQHGGIIMGIGGVAGHSHKYFHRREYGYFGRLKIVQNLSGVTAACLMMRRSVFEEVGGFEEFLSHAFNDVDLCLKVRSRGYLIVYTPFAELYHHESISRGYETTPEKKDRFHQEWAFCDNRWGHMFQAGDPYYNCHLTLLREDFSIGLGEAARYKSDKSGVVDKGL